MGWVSDLRELERTAFHEAGHFIAASSIGLNFEEKISIFPSDDDGTLGRVIGEGLDRAFAPSVERIEAHVVALCAGFVAQRRFDPDQPEATALAEAGSDFDQADKWSDTLGRSEALARARTLLEKHWREVDIVARALLQRGELNAAEADWLTFLVSGGPDEIARAAWRLLHAGWQPDELEALTGTTFTAVET